MSCHPSAYICFGVKTEEECPYPLIPQKYLEKDKYGTSVNDDFDEDDLREKYESPISLVLEAEGIKSPWDDCPEPPHPMSYYNEKEWRKANHPEWEQAYERYFAKKEELEKDIPITVVSSGYCGDDFYHVIALAGVIESNGEYGAEEIDPYALVKKVTPERIKAAEEFCERFELIEFKDPRWYLVTTYG